LIISNWNNPECGAESYDAGSLQSVEDCMNMATEVYTEFSPEWYELVNKCIAGLCEAHIIDCD
jgi:hypothetical protein